MLPKIRFIKNGPLIPGELILAQEQSRVVFFCGAGVSYARAKLPNFYQLAERVCDSLKVSSSSSVYQLLQEVKKLERRTKITGLISMDRIFSILEQEFDLRDIDKAVAMALRPVNDDLSAHRILLELAKTPNGRIQLVTTNFDRLFSKCQTSDTRWVAPRLPNLLHHDELDNVVYLHGRVTENYDGAENRFVLSSSEFGRAYLSEGWATEFFKNVLSKYLVVFIGYSADDPPISYLLEALSSKTDISGKIYAFQEGSPRTAQEKWESKGVTAISYSDKNNHIALWDTLEAWSEKSKDHECWYNSIIAKTRKTPNSLSAYERSQVAYVVSHKDGAKKFANSIPAPRAEWLCVFDEKCRYADFGSGRQFFLKEKEDRFKRYRLDIDKQIPDKLKNDEKSSWLKGNVWGAFKINEYDLRELNKENIISITGTSYYSLPPRIMALG